MDDIILDAIKRANKLGAKGIEVVGAFRPLSTADNPMISLITRIPVAGGASEKPWYESW